MAENHTYEQEFCFNKMQDDKLWEVYGANIEWDKKNIKVFLKTNDQFGEYKTYFDISDKNNFDEYVKGNYIDRILLLKNGLVDYKALNSEHEEAYQNQLKTYKGEIVEDPKFDYEAEIAWAEKQLKEMKLLYQPKENGDDAEKQNLAKQISEYAYGSDKYSEDILHPRQQKAFDQYVDLPEPSLEDLKKQFNNLKQRKVEERMKLQEALTPVKQDIQEQIVNNKEYRLYEISKYSLDLNNDGLQNETKRLLNTYANKQEAMLDIAEKNHYNNDSYIRYELEEVELNQLQNQDMKGEQNMSEINENNKAVEEKKGEQKVEHSYLNNVWPTSIKEFDNVSKETGKPYTTLSVNVELADGYAFVSGFKNTVDVFDATNKNKEVIKVKLKDGNEANLKTVRIQANTQYNVTDPETKETRKMLGSEIAKQYAQVRKAKYEAEKVTQEQDVTYENK